MKPAPPPNLGHAAQTAANAWVPPTDCTHAPITRVEQGTLMPPLATTRILHAPEIANAVDYRRPWGWPLPRLDGVAPCIITSTKGSLPDHVEIGYPGRASSPSLVPVFAAQDGIVTYASTRGRPTLCLDHAGGWSTQYAELEHVLAVPTDRYRGRRKARVRAGDVLGHARRSPLGIHFALFRLTDGRSVTLHPAAWMHTWSVLPWFAEPTAPAQHAA
jgi:murein DD-endopeptidase MepM/ murein hydrolase activator NlpD